MQTFSCIAVIPFTKKPKREKANGFMVYTVHFAEEQMAQFIAELVVNFAAELYNLKPLTFDKDSESVAQLSNAINGEIETESFAVFIILTFVTIF